ncbi:hypothetical protein V6Z11_D07G134600 [Gossypium hirsutum]
MEQQRMKTPGDAQPASDTTISVLTLLAFSTADYKASYVASKRFRYSNVPSRTTVA